MRHKLLNRQLLVMLRVDYSAYRRKTKPPSSCLELEDICLRRSKFGCLLKTYMYNSILKPIVAFILSENFTASDG